MPLYPPAGSGGGTVDTVVAGNNIDVDSTDPANPIVAVETLTLADVSDVTASATEVNYTDGVTSAIQTQIDGKQPLDSDLTTIAGLTATTDNFMVATTSAWASRTPTQARGQLGLGSIATQAANNVSITGGSVTGITDLTVADGGTGASTLTDHGVVIAHGTSALTAVAPGTSGNVLTSDGTDWASTAPSGGNGYVLSAFVLKSTVIDATTYYFAGVPDVGLSTTAASVRIYIPKTGTVKAIYGTVHNAGTLSTNEASTIYFRLNNTTDTTISTTLTTDAIATAFNNGSLSVAVTAGDYFQIKWTTPTWSTNPGQVTFNVSVYIE